MTKNQIILDIINQKLCDLLDEFESNEFLELVKDRIFSELGEDVTGDLREDIRKVFVSPFSNNLSGWVQKKFNELK